MSKISSRNSEAIARAIHEREDFDTHGALKGRTWFIGHGILPTEWQDRIGHDQPTYVIYSYDTPIAWRSKRDGEWVVPDVRYSVTTSKHQGRARYAIHRAGVLAHIEEVTA